MALAHHTAKQQQPLDANATGYSPTAVRLPWALSPSTRKTSAAQRKFPKFWHEGGPRTLKQEQLGQVLQCLKSEPSGAQNSMARLSKKFPTPAPQQERS